MIIFDGRERAKMIEIAHAKFAPAPGAWVEMRQRIGSKVWSLCIMSPNAINVRLERILNASLNWMNITGRGRVQRISHSFCGHASLLYMWVTYEYIYKFVYVYMEHKEMMKMLLYTSA